MAFGDLTAQHQANAGAALFRGEERDEEVAGVGDAVAFVSHLQDELSPVHSPFDSYAAAGFDGRVGRVADQIDEQLIELVAVSPERKGWAVDHSHFQPGFEAGRSTDPDRDVHNTQDRRREFREARVGIEEPRQGLGSA